MADVCTPFTFYEFVSHADSESSVSQRSIQ